MEKTKLTSVAQWPEMPIAAWNDTRETLHRWTQVVGKVRLALAAPINHSWGVTLYVTARGLTTSAMPYEHGVVEMTFDFVTHQLRIELSDGQQRSVLLKPRSVADFYADVMTSLRALGVNVSIWTTPVEIEDRTPFEKDEKHGSYDSEFANRFWRVLAESDRVFGEFRSRFIGKCSPVHFFWGSFDMAVTRFSGRPAPEHGPVPNIAHSIVKEAYSHEVSSCGFWPGMNDIEPIFYSYAYPEPKGFSSCQVQPREATYSKDLGEFLLPYDAVRTADSDEALLAFCQTTYEAAADCGGWNRGALERPAE